MEGVTALFIYKVRYNWSVLTPFLSSALGGANGEFPINAVVVTKNEVF